MKEAYIPKNLSIKEVRFNGEDYLTPTLDQLDLICFNLAKEIASSGFKPARIVAIAKGGLAWVRTLADYMSQDEVTSIQIQFYGKHMTRGERPVIIQSLPVSVAGENILIFDDVADTGESLTIASNYLDSCGADEIKIATLFLKPHSVVKPDFHGPRVTGWVVFPHEVKETIDELVPKWEKKGVSGGEIEKRLIELGFSPEKVDFFLRESQSSSL